MKMRGDIIEFIILISFFFGGVFQISCCLTISEYGIKVLRRVKAGSFPLLTASEIEQAVEESGGWEGLVGDPDRGKITRLWGQDLSRPLVIRNKGSQSFYKHVIIQLLDEYFVRTGRYSYNHITPALAPAEDGRGVYYISVEGEEGFSWEITDYFCAKLEEFSAFVSAFKEAGFNMAGDISDVDDGRVSKNIILEVDFRVPDSAWEEYRRNGQAIYTIPKQWKRIDLDGPSCHHIPNESSRFLDDNAESLRTVLGNDKYRLLRLAYTLYQHYGNISEEEQTEFNRLFAPYQHEILQEYLP